MYDETTQDKMELARKKQPNHCGEIVPTRLSHVVLLLSFNRRLLQVVSFDTCEKPLMPLPLLTLIFLFSANWINSVMLLLEREQFTFTLDVDRDR